MTLRLRKRLVNVIVDNILGLADNLKVEIEWYSVDANWMIREVLLTLILAQIVMKGLHQYNTCII